MACDVMVLNTAAVDIRHGEFSFVTALAGKGGLAKCPNSDMPDYTEEQYAGWIAEGAAMPGGPGNTAPLLAKADVATAVGVNVGKGRCDGMDACGRFFHDRLASTGIDMSATHVHDTLPTGLTFIYEAPGDDRGGMAYFPNANNDFDFDVFKKQIERLQPRIVHYMYSGLSDRGDANGGRDLATFIRWCRGQGVVTIVDSHTLTGDPQGLIAKGTPVEAYHLLEPLLGELDVFFTSADESKMIVNTLEGARKWTDYSEEENCLYYLNWVAERFWQGVEGARAFGVTVGNGAYQVNRNGAGTVSTPAKTSSRFMAGGTVDLVGAGDSFRAGLLTYLANNLETFKTGTLDWDEAVQMGNLMASLYVKAPLGDRYSNIRPYANLKRIVDNGKEYHSFEELRTDLDA